MVRKVRGSAATLCYALHDEDTLHDVQSEDESEAPSMYCRNDDTSNIWCGKRPTNLVSVPMPESADYWRNGAVLVLSAGDQLLHLMQCPAKA